MATQVSVRMNDWAHKVCAMRLDTHVPAHEFVHAIDAMRREARESAYRDLREFMERGCPGMRLEDLIDRLASGQGWPVAEATKTTGPAV